MSEQVPEYYSDVFYLRTNPWGVAITFAAASPKEGIPDHDTCVVRISHVTAKALSTIIRKQLKTYEKDSHTMVNIPASVMKELGIGPGDW